MAKEDIIGRDRFKRRFTRQDFAGWALRLSMFIPRSEWLRRAAQHRAGVLQVLPPDKFMEPDHPVFNFLRHYLGLRDLEKLMRWSPGFGVVLEKASEAIPNELFPQYAHVLDDESVVFRSGDLGRFRFWQRVLEAPLQNNPNLSCFGLHEWAMLYHKSALDPPPSGRFQPRLQRRVSQEVLNETVEKIGVRCTHFDAMRFFSEESRAFSKFDGISREEAMKRESPCCVHSTMDLLKIATRLGPVFSSSTVLGALKLAIKARKIDIAASPYNASEFTGLSAIKIESEQGRNLYKRLQINLMEQSRPIRKKMIQELSFTQTGKQ